MSRISAEKALERILHCGIVPIIRGKFSRQQVFGISEILLAEKIDILEITLNSTDAIGIISALRKEFGKRLLTGAGTVRNHQMFRNAVDAGAEFTIAPNLDIETATASVQTNVLHLPGVLTPTEIHSAVSLGCKAVKLFPIDTFGPQYLRAVRAPLNDVIFIPTGGVTAQNIAEFKKAGASAVGVGSSLVSGPTQAPEDLKKRASDLRKGWEE